MPNEGQETIGVYEVRDAQHFSTAVAGAIARSAEEGRMIKFTFKNVVVTVCADSDPELIYRDYKRADTGCIAKEVGPSPNHVLTEEEKASDARIQAQREHNAQMRRAEYDPETKAGHERVEARLTNAPAIELVDEAHWLKFKANNSDGTYGGLAAYAERWARLLQVEMAAGKDLEEVANATSHEADFEGMSGGMHGGAVFVLVKVWKHGEQLRRWHNLDNQAAHEGERANKSGGVLNPAVYMTRS